MTRYGTDLSNHNTQVNFTALRNLGNVDLVTHKLSEGIGWTDPTVAGRAPSLRQFPAAGFYHVLWPTNSQDNPQNQAAWFLDEIERIAPWMFTHPCPVLQGDFELFSNFVPYRAPTIAECNEFLNWCGHYWAQRTQNPCARVAYAPYWLYGDGVKQLSWPYWSSSYVNGSGDYRALYPGDGHDPLWTQAAGHTATVGQYTASASFPGAASGVDADALIAANATEVQDQLFGDVDMPLTDAEIQAIADRVWAKALKDADGNSIAAGDRLRRAGNRLAALLPAGNADQAAAAVDRGELFQALLNSQTVPRIGANGQPDPTLPDSVFGNVLAYIDDRVLDTKTALAELQGEFTQSMADIATALQTLSAQIANLQPPAPGLAVKYTMVGELTPEPPAPPAQSAATPPSGA